MNMESLIATFAEMAGLGAFIYYLFRALSAKISGLEGVVGAQRDVIEAMSRRIDETEKIGGIYKNLLSDLPSDLENYKTIVSKTKDDMIVELKSQKEEAERRLSEVRKEIQSSGAPKEKVSRHLAVLKNLLAPPKKPGYSTGRELDLRAVSEFDGRTLESVVPLILESQTLEEFLGRAGYSLNLTEDASIIKTVFGGERTMKVDGEDIRDARASQSLHGWYLLANNRVWLNQACLDEWKREFREVRFDGETSARRTPA